MLIGPHSLIDTPAQSDLEALAIGVFDGVHLGHQAVIRSLHSQTGPIGVLTFDPHPLTVVAPDRAPARLTTLDQKAALLSKHRVERVITLRFDSDLKNSTAEFFFQQLLRIAPNIRSLAVGESWVFGVNRAGNVKRLEEWAAPHKIRVMAIPPVSHMGAIVSSTRIRELIVAKNFAGVDELLGWSYSITGEVVHGEGKGRLLGFPTANLANVPQLIPPQGTYGVKVQINANPERYLGVFNYGIRPTMTSEAKPSAEVHLLDFSGDLYGQQITLDHFHWLRPEMKFSSLRELTDQIGADIVRSRDHFSLD